MAKVIDYFFSISSPWAFIGLKPFAELAERMGAEVRPYLTTVVEENGGIYSRNRPDARRLYWLKDLERDGIRLEFVLTGLNNFHSLRPTINSLREIERRYPMPDTVNP